MRANDPRTPVALEARIAKKFKEHSKRIDELAAPSGSAARLTSERAVEAGEKADSAATDAANAATDAAGALDRADEAATDAAAAQRDALQAFQEAARKNAVRFSPDRPGSTAGGEGDQWFRRVPGSWAEQRRNLLPSPIGPGRPASAADWRASRMALSAVAEEGGPALLGVADGSGGVYIEPASIYGMAVGDELRFSVDVKTDDASIASTMRLRLIGYDGLAISGGTTTQAIRVGEFARLTVTGTVTAVGANSFARLFVWPSASSVPSGARMFVRRALYEARPNMPADGSYFDGDTAAGDADRYGWLGTPGASASVREVAAGDQWVVTEHWSFMGGRWVQVSDQAVIAAAQEASDANQRAQEAFERAQAAMDLAASIKPGSSVIPSYREPTASDTAVTGSVWFQMDEANQIIGQWQLLDQGNGPTWVKQQIASDQIVDTLYGKRLVGAEVEGTTSVSGGYFNVTGGAPDGSDSTEYGLGIRQFGEPGTWRNTKRLSDQVFVGPELTGTPNILGTFESRVDRSVLSSAPGQRVIFSYDLVERVGQSGQFAPREQYLAALGHLLAPLVDGETGRVDWGARSIGARDFYARHARLVQLTVKPGGLVALPAESIDPAALKAGIPAEKITGLSRVLGSVGRTSDHAFSTAGWTTIPMTTSFFSVETSLMGGGIWVRYAGVYRVTAAVSFNIDGNVGTFRDVSIFVDGVEWAAARVPSGSGASSKSYVATVSAAIPLNGGEVLTLRTRAGSGQGTVTAQASTLSLAASREQA